MPRVIDIFDAQDVTQGAPHEGNCMSHPTNHNPQDFQDDEHPETY